LLIQVPKIKFKLFSFNCYKISATKSPATTGEDKKEVQMKKVNVVEAKEVTGEQHVSTVPNAGPAVMLLCALYGIDHNLVTSSGPKGLLKSDVIQYIADNRWVIVALQGWVIVALQGCVIVTLQGCVIVALQGCVNVVLQDCVIVALQGCVISVLQDYMIVAL
jgi:hypothetical protein